MVRITNVIGEGYELDTTTGQLYNLQGEEITALEVEKQFTDKGSTRLGCFYMALFTLLLTFVLIYFK